LFATFTPDSRTDQTISAFVQDRIDLHEERVFLTLGAKLEHNDYTGYEQQPNVRITWLPGNRQTVWAAVSEAVRVPARLNTDLRLFAPVAVPGLGLPLYINVNGTPNFASEELTAYEAGYRVQLRESLSIDLALFNNYYDHLQTQEASPLDLVPGPPSYYLLPVTLANLMEGESYGGTFVLNWQATSRWRLQFQYAHLQLDFATKPGSSDTGAVRLAGNSPKNHVTLQSFVELPRNLRLYTSIRHVDELPSLGIPSYLTVDWTLAWLPTDRYRVSFTVESANDARRMEFNDGRLIERSAFARLTWTF
jgi:iron complex outermembrane receptor protein